MDKYVIASTLEVSDALAEYADVLTRVCARAAAGMPVTVRPELVQQGALEARAKVRAWLRGTIIQEVGCVDVQ